MYPWRSARFHESLACPFFRYWWTCNAFWPYRSSNPSRCSGSQIRQLSPSPGFCLAWESSISVGCRWHSCRRLRSDLAWSNHAISQLTQLASRRAKRRQSSPQSLRVSFFGDFVHPSSLFILSKSPLCGYVLESSCGSWQFCRPFAWSCDRCRPSDTTSGSLTHPWWSLYQSTWSLLSHSLHLINVLTDYPQRWCLPSQPWYGPAKVSDFSLVLSLHHT